MNYKWSFFKKILFATFILVASFLVKQDFFADMLVTGIAVLVSTCAYIDELPTKICDPKNIMVLAETSTYAGYEVVASKRYISSPIVEAGLKAIAIAAPMIFIAYKNYQPKNQNRATIRLEIPEAPRINEEDMETEAQESIRNTLRPLP